MKKTLAILLALVLAMATLVSGCGSSDEGGEEGAAALKVGFIFIGAINDGGFTQSMYEGALAADEHFGDQMEFLYVENINDGDTSASTDAAVNLIDQGCNVIVGCSYG
ncbi:MAG: BMP family ABC transporter substrate-binding protein, partial [Clostridiales bacterium]|nr:BMP family ABC transporter substrate-binding protein [Clostridiales bacterium]